MNKSKFLFVCFVMGCFGFVFYNAFRLNSIKYNVLERDSFEVHKTFNNKEEAEKYVAEYKDFHDYILQEIPAR